MLLVVVSFAALLPTEDTSLTQQADETLLDDTSSADDAGSVPIAVHPTSLISAGPGQSNMPTPMERAKDFMRRAGILKGRSRTFSARSIGLRERAQKLEERSRALIPGAHRWAQGEYPNGVLIDEDATEDCQGAAFDRSAGSRQRRAMVHQVSQTSPLAAMNAKVAVERCGIYGSVAVAAATNTKYVWHAQKFAESIPGLPCVLVVVPDYLEVNTTMFPKVHPVWINGVSTWKPHHMWCTLFTNGSMAGWRFASVLKMGGVSLLLGTGTNVLLFDGDWRMKPGKTVYPFDLFFNLTHGAHDVVSVRDQELLNIGLTWVRNTMATRKMMALVHNRSYSAWDQAVFNSELHVAAEAISCCVAGDWAEPGPQDPGYPLLTYFERTAFEDRKAFPQTEHPKCSPVGTPGACTVPHPDDDYSNFELFPRADGEPGNYKPQHYYPDGVDGHHWRRGAYVCRNDDFESLKKSGHEDVKKTRVPCRMHRCSKNRCPAGMF